jgi:hypothetical protein
MFEQGLHRLTETEILEIEKGASKVEIKKAYHKVRRQRRQRTKPHI